MRSEYQREVTEIRVLLPDRLGEGRKHPVIYVLPVERGRESRYGDGLAEIKKLDLHNQSGTIFVAPTFSDLPWYGDHPTDPKVRQESYLLRVIVPFIDRHYPVEANPSKRLLLGFSKSGWGAFALLLRHPKVFGKAACWDAPLLLDRPDRYGANTVFPTQKDFDEYRMDVLLAGSKEAVRKGNRLIIVGYGNFREHHVRAHSLMMRLGIEHVYRDAGPLKHDWHSGWVREAVALLLKDVVSSDARESRGSKAQNQGGQP